MCQSVRLDALLSHPDGPPLRSALPVKATKGSKGGATGSGATGKAGAAELQALDQCLDRLEQLMLLIAQQVGRASGSDRPAGNTCKPSANL